MLKVIAPTRIDLAGGTLDVYPLYLFAYPKVYTTINMAISLYVEITLEPRVDTKILLRSTDLQLTVAFDNFQQLEEQIDSTELELIVKILHFFKVEGVEITTTSNAPRGSGLGNSSSLVVALVFLLNTYTHSNYTKTQMIQIAQGIETSVLKIPTGRQDYIAAMYGGINEIKFGILEDEINQIKISDKFQKKLEQQSALFYVGEPTRFTSTKENPNWDVIKNIVEQQSLEILNELNNITAEMKNALVTENFSLLLEVIKVETKIRKSLSKAIITPIMQELLQDIINYKICGAGGGGMLWLLDPLKNKKLLRFKIDTLGVRLVSNDEI